MKKERELDDPAPVVLITFGLMLIISVYHNARCGPISPSMLAVCVFYSGIAYYIAGLTELDGEKRTRNIAITTYALIWSIPVVLILIPNLSWINDYDNTLLGRIARTTSYVLFSVVLSTWVFLRFNRIEKVYRFVFICTVLLYPLLAIGVFIPTVRTLACGVGIDCGILVLYIALGKALNDLYGLRIVPSVIIK